MEVNFKITELLNLLKKNNKLPSHIEKTVYNNIYFYNCYNSKKSEIISDGVSTGIHEIESIALLKALVEWVERACFLDGCDDDTLACKTEHSDGFAAFPYFSHNEIEFAKLKAKENALDEAIERYSWSVWWDNMTSAKIFNNFKFVSSRCLTLIEIIQKYTPLEEIILISPNVEGYKERTTCIFFAKLLKGGYISGGAAGTIHDQENIHFRALSELVRHSIGYSRSLHQNLKPKNLYEERLLYFASGLGNNLVTERLNSSIAKTDKKIILPKLIFDTEIKHIFSDSVIVHRCLFENQPPFVGGEVERLCI